MFTGISADTGIERYLRQQDATAAVLRRALEPLEDFESRMRRSLEPLEAASVAVRRAFGPESALAEVVAQTTRFQAVVFDAVQKAAQPYLSFTDDFRSAADAIKSLEISSGIEAAMRQLQSDSAIARHAFEGVNLAERITLEGAWPARFASALETLERDLTFNRTMTDSAFLGMSTPPNPQPIEAVDDQATFDPEHWRLLYQTEQSLRLLVSKALFQRYGQSWPSLRLSTAMRRRWERGQQLDRDSGRQVLALIHYSNFMDLLEIIVADEHWADLFKSVFVDRDDISVSLKRLQPIRNALAHNRPLGRFDVLSLWAEGARILRVAGSALKS